MQRRALDRVLGPVGSPMSVSSFKPSSADTNYLILDTPGGCVTGAWLIYLVSAPLPLLLGFFLLL